MSESISILGCGFVGLPLSERSLSVFSVVKGLYRSLGTKENLESLGVLPFYGSFSVSSPVTFEGDLDFFNSDVLVVTLPYSRSFSDPTLYLEQCQCLVSFIQNSSIQKVIFTSSTSYYGDENEWATELDAYDRHSKRAAVLHEVEQLFLSLPVTSIVLRLGGLYGGDRHLRHRLLSGKSIEMPSRYMNVVHVEDVVSVIVSAVKVLSHSCILNVVEDAHPIRREFYTALGASLGLSPSFLADDGHLGKRVSNAQLKALLSYTFKHDISMRPFA